MKTLEYDVEISNSLSPTLSPLAYIRGWLNEGKSSNIHLIIFLNEGERHIDVLPLSFTLGDLLAGFETNIPAGWRVE